MTLTTTLNRILEHDPCNQRPDYPRDSGWNRLIDHLGENFDRDAEINLLTILDSNGVSDCVWALRATIQDSEIISRKLAVAFAKRALPNFERCYPDDKRPRLCIEAVENYCENPCAETKELMLIARNAARNAAREVEQYVGRDAAWGAAWSATADATWIVAQDAAGDNEIEEQRKIIKELLK